MLLNNWVPIKQTVNTILTKVEFNVGCETYARLNQS